MFDGNVTNQFPHSIADCNREDPVAASLWKWARVIRYLSVVLPILTFIVTAVYVGVMSNYVGEGAGYEFLPIGIITGVALFIAMLITSVLLSAAARVVQNTSVTANAELYRLNMTNDVQSSSKQPHHALSVSDVERQTTTSPARKFESIFLGKYRQSNTGEENDIEWLVIDMKGNKALVISKYALDCKPYNDIQTNVTWETCSLRKWLNGEFLNSAFSEKEKEKILTTNVTAEPNPKYVTPAGNDTKDKVFLLSINQSKEYFESPSERSCKATIYSQKQGADTKKGDFCWWWLRSPGYDSDYAAYVNYVGSVNFHGNYVGSVSGAVRPALWIKLD